MRTLWMAAAAATLLFGATASSANEQMPPSVHTQATDEGVVFTDAAGMTLYSMAADDAMRGTSQCTKQLHWTATGGGANWPVPANDKRKSCAEKNPPFKAGPDDKAVGKWSVITRSDETFQWAYDGRPVYRSARDRSPGDVNAAHVINARQAYSALRPLLVPTGMPAGFEMTRTRAGLILVTAEKQVLYANGDMTKGKPCSHACEAGWQPVLAPESVAAKGSDWTVIQRADLRRQWAFRGQALYLPDPQENALATLAAVQVTAKGFAPRMTKSAWRPVVYQTVTGIPEAIKVEDTLLGQVFATADGRSLYLYFCTEESRERTTCDEPGDAAAYRSSLCGTGQECARRWHPYVAAADAKPVGQWTIIEVADPPFRDAKGQLGEGVPVARGWAYAGRPVYTYFEDERPGDVNGDSIRGDYNTAGFFAAVLPGELSDGQ